MVVELAKLAHFIDFQISPQKIDTRYVPRQRTIQYIQRVVYVCNEVSR
jgi:hypothetical protein